MRMASLNALLGIRKHAMKAQGKRHRRLPGAYGSVGNMTRVKYV
jgi:hypothetical protein